MSSTRTSPIIAGELAKSVFRMKNILVPMDFTPASRLALDHARGFAALFQAHIHVIHVVANLVPPQAATSADRLVQDGKRDLATFLKETKGEFPLERTEVLYGDLLDELNGYITREKIDLVVIGSSGRSGATRLMLGSMAEYIFRGLDAPVLAMGPNARVPLAPGHGLQHLLLCESLVPDAERAMRYGCALAEHANAAVTVLHALPESLKNSPKAPRFQRMFEEELRTGATHPALFSQADYIVTFGDPARETVRVARAVKADLIVLGAKPAEMWQTHLGRGTAFRIVSSAPCPILSVRSKPEPTS